MLIEQPPTETHSATSRFQGVDLAGLQGDGTARASDDGRRRVLACPPFPADATPQVCVAAWHGVLHWLRYTDEPVTTCLVGQRAHACWPIVTSVGAATSLAQLLADVVVQWAPPAENWLDLRDPDHAELLDPLRCHAIRLEAGPEDIATEFALVREGDSWCISCAASRYSEAYQRNLMTLWHQFIVALLERPHSLLSAQTCTDGGDARGMQQAGMAGPVVSIAGNLVQRFAACAAATPDKPAVIDDRGSIGFAELDALSGTWAQALRAAGAQRGGYVGVAFGRDRAMVAAQLAVLKTGAAFVPMDVTQPEMRLQAMAEDTDMRLVLGDAAAASILRSALSGVRCLVADEQPATPGASPDAVVAVGTDDPAYVIFTSGSTGRPKGVKVSHGNLLNFVVHLSEWVGANDVLSQFAPFTFDASVAEIHTAILNGATLVILSAALIDDPDCLQEYMSEQGVTFAAFPPQYAQHLSPAKLPQLKTLLTAGSTPDHALIGRWQPHVRYINAYGPTETTILSTAWQASRTPGAHEPIVIGTPICNTEVRVVNRFNQSLPRGMIGELLIGGEGVTHGYIKRDALTRERFITLDRMRWYRSGDLSCFDADGQLIFAGRVDSQIKLRGHRLEPGEVETALLAIDGIRQAAVAAVDVAATKQLVAFCVGTQQPEDGLRERLRQLLPAWAQPNRIVWLERIPLTPNGKTDYGSLVANLAQIDAPVEPTDYADALEAQIAAIWRSVLQRPRILREDSFIHLGGDSLTSLVVTSAVKRLGYQPTSAQLLQHPRLADYARLLRAGGQRVVERDYASRPGAAPLAPIQGWFFGLQLAHPGTFCQSLVFESDEPIDVERLSRACTRLAGYHDQLRARFVPDAQATAGWRQEILPESMTLPAPHVLELVDSLLDTTSEAYCRRLAQELRIDAAPLFRLAVISSPRRSRVVWVLHHLIVDTVSHGILLDDLHQLYRSAETDVTQVLPGKSVAYGDWAGRLQDQVAGNSGQLLAQWRPVLDAVEQADALPLRRRGQSSALAVSRHLLSREETSRLLQCAGSGYRQSPEELVLAATYLALARTLDVQRVAIDVEWHGRDEALAGLRGVDRTVGWFTSVHPLCMAVPAGGALGSSWLMALKETRAAIPRRGRDFYTLRYLGDDSGVRAEFARCRRPDVLFNFSGVVQRTYDAWRSVPVAAIELGEGNTSPYLLSVESEIRDGELIIGLYHDAAAWADGTIGRLGEAIVQCLGEVIAHCSEATNRRWTPSAFPQLALSQAQADRLPATVVGACALTDMQQTMLRHQNTYQVHMCYRMPRAWDEAAWREAVANWVARHDCLRTYIQEWDDGDACQVVLQKVALPLAVHRAAPGTSEELAQALLRKARSVPVRLDHAPLFRLDAVDEGGDGFLVVLGIHHIVHDGWSIELLLNDLLQTYRHQRGEAVPLPDAPLAGMADVVAQQQRLRASTDWCAYFSGLPWAPTACQLPARAKRKTAANADAPDTRLHLGTLAADLVAAVRAAARERGVTVNCLWLAGYVGLLRYLGGQPQVRCGVIQTGRVEEILGVETITGCCVNTLPLVLDVPATATFGDIAATISGQLERMRAAAAFPLSVIHEAVKPVLEDEIFDSLFNVESRRYGSAQELRPTLVGGYESTNYGFIFGLIERDVTVVDGATLSAYDVRIGYDADRYDAVTVARWLEIYACCMEALVAQPHEPWHRLQLLPAALQRRVVEEWNDTRRDYPHERCVHELFRVQAELHPTRPALLYRDTTVSYAELDQRTDALARVLCAQGVGPETVVGLVAERSPDMVVAILAIFKAGGAYVPIDPRYPADRVRHMVKDVGCKVVLFQRRDLASAIPAELDITPLYLDEPVADAPDAAPSAAHDSRQLAYVMYTSGSTGNPKGVMIEHRSIVRLIANSADIAFAPDDRILLTSAPGFDVTTWEVWSALLNGLPLAIVDEETLLDPAALAAEIRAKRVTTLWLIAPLFNQLVQEQPDLFAGVRQLMIGGDALSAPHVRLARRANPGLRVINGYGPTENTSFSTYHFVSDADAEIVPIGRPITNSTAYVINRDGQLLPPAVNGELYVGGPGVARGYLNQPELTAAKFVPDPYSAEPGACLYRTGDLVRWREDGLIDFLGRIDHQVKIRGFRVELGEIETAIANHDEVKQVVVLVKQNGNQKQLVAYLVAKRADAVDKTALIASLVTRLRTALPEYMVPAAFVVLDAMPRNANGKIDRARLPEPDASAYAHGAHAEPENEAERTLWSIWKEVLGTDSFGVTDGFYAIGGDSILTIQVVAKAGKQGLALTPRLMVEEQTIRKLVGRVASPEAGKAAPAPPPTPAERPVQGQQRLLPIQLQFLQDDRIDVDRYCQYTLVALPHGITHDMLRSALAALVARHDALRLKFRETAGGWVAYYRPELLSPTPAMLEAFLGTTEPPGEFDPAVHVAQVLAQLDIRQGRLFGWRRVVQGGEQRLLWVMHHMVVDVVSWRILAADLATALAQLGRGEAVALEAKPASYQDWASRLHDYAYSPALEQERAYWIGQLSQSCARLRFDLPQAGEGMQPLETTTSIVEASLGAEDTRLLLQQANTRHATRTQQLLIAALGRALGEWLAADAVRIDLEGHGRESPQGADLFDGLDASGTVGWFTTLYPLQLSDVRAEIGAQIRRTKTQLEAVPHKGLGYGVLRRLAQDEEVAACADGASEILFNYLGQFDAATVGGSEVSPRRRRTHALRIGGLVRDGVLLLRFDYSREQFEHGTIAALAARYVEALRAIVAHCMGTADTAVSNAFGLAELAPVDIAALKSRYPGCKDVYPCTGMQQGLLLFSARAPQSGVYLTQLRIELDGANAARLRQSWQALLERHDVLRTAFVDCGLACLLQVVCERVELPWREVDGRTLRGADALERLLAEERTQPFNVAAAPLMRLLLVRTSDEGHCLAWTHHHALLDGWSIGLLINELFEIYAGSEPATAARPAWRHHVEWLKSRDRPAAERYWHAYFDGLDIAASASLPLAPLRADDAAPPRHYEQALETRMLPVEATARLTRLARAEGVGLGPLMFAAWGLLLSKYNAEPEVLFGYAASGRSPELAGSESLVGICINSLPLRLKIDGDCRLGAWLKEIQRRQLDHDDHGHFALADIQRCSGARGGQALFDSLVVVENYPLDRSVLSAAANLPRIVAIESVEQNDFALNLAVYPGERLALKLAYRTALFDAQTIATLLRRLERLLASFARGGGQTLAQLSLLSEAEQERAVRQWNDTAVAYPGDRALPALFEATARSRGAAVAIVCGEETWTYEQLDERVRILSAWLARNGVSAGSRVALSLRKEPTLVAAMLAVTRLGAAYVPIALDCPPERRAFLLADAGIRCTLTQRSGRDAPADENLLCLEDCPAELDDADGRLVDVDPQATAYVIYTSGTTGTPKGVAISHRNLVNFCSWCTQVDLFRAGDRTTQFAPYTFDASAGEIFAGLLAGTELHLLADALIQDPRALAQYLCAHDIRFAAFPPTYLQQMDPALVPPDLTLLTAGSAPTLELVRRWGERCRYINGYGPTETTILSSAWVCEPGALKGRTLSIGKPISNTTMYVVDRLGQLCAPGLTGEIWIGGDGVAQAYLNRPELTDCQFIPDPWVEGGRVYRTGDLGRWLDDGCIEFVGRRDRQVKLRGFRIELNEIEGRIQAHPQVRDAAVLVRGTGGEQRLLAWVVPAQASAGEEELKASIRAFMRLSMPEYMLPQAILILEQLPLTKNGKLDEKALPEPAELDVGGDNMPVGTATEARLAAIWASVLHLRTEQIGAKSDFFALGGHSLLAMRVIARVRAELGAEMDVAELFAWPVLADFAATVDQASRDALPPISRVPRDKPLMLSFAQHRLWFLGQMEGVSQTYHIPGTLRLRGRLDATALRRALDRIVARHEVLRTTFHAIDGEPTQRIAAEDVGFTLRTHDFSDRTDAEQAAQRLISDAFDAPFDLMAGPLIRGDLVRVGPDDHVLLIMMHHIVMDAWSLALLQQELQALYAAYVSGGDDPLPPLALHYADYAAWQQQWLTGALWQEQSDYWRRTLTGAPPLLELPIDRPRPVQQDYAGDLVELGFDVGTTVQLKALSRHHGTTLFITLLTAWSVVLSRLSGQHDLVIGTPVANRAQLDTEPMIGFFVNPLALRLDLSGNPTLAELLQRVKRQVLDAQRYQELPFEQVVEIVQPPRSLAHTPVFQLMLNWQDQGLNDYALEGVQATPLRPPGTLSKYDLTLDIGENGDRIAGAFEYATALFDAETMQRQVGYLQRVVAAMVADMERPAQSLDLLGDDEHRLLQAFNDTSRPELYERGWPETFDEQAARTPDRIAVRCGTAQLSYRELQQRATRLAAKLVAQGAGPGQIVALLDQRGIDLLVMIVAVLKSGAAYMPLDPEHPSQRWLDVLQEAQPLILWVGDGLATEKRWLRRKWTAGQVSSMADLLAGPAPATTALPYPALDDLAYVLFTSGSTGKPKGVMIEHRGMVNNMRSKFEPLGLGADDVIAQTASQCFDISVWQFLTALLLGGKVLIVANDLTRDPEALLDHLTAERATVWEPVPSVMQAALTCRKPMTCLRWVMPTGEALSRELVARWFEQYPGIPLMNAYGPAECSDDVAFQAILAPVERVLIGKPVANAQLHVVDEHLMLLPLGAVGELAISGPVVGRGYIGRPEETQAAFRTNPRARHAGEQRVYLTGDLVRRWPDGSLEFIGRKDFQVKIRGFRIELGEIESCLAQHPAVREAIVAARERAPGDHHLVAYVTLEAPVGAEALQAHLRAQLPDYMMPAAIVVLGALPLNANGKVDRKALPEPTSAAFARAEYEAPQSDTERAIAALWQELLQLPQVGRGDSYFDLGGNSLLLIRMLSRWKDQGMSLGVTEVYQLRTVSACAAAIDAQRHGAADWPLDDGWRHAIVTLGGNPRRTALLLDRSESARRKTLQTLLATVEPQQRPHFVRYADDLAALSQQVGEAGIAALAPVQTEAALFDALRAQLKVHQQRLANAPVETSLRFSPIQRNLMAWQSRDRIDMVALQGWYTAAELQQAFADVAAEQDLLRAAPDDTPAQWRLLEADAIAAASIPAVDLSAHDPARHGELLKRLGAELLAARKTTPLAYAAAVVSLGDLEHRLLLAVDHLVWDGMSAAVLQQRLQQHLRGTAGGLSRNYRSYVDAVWRLPDAQAAAMLNTAIARVDLAATMHTTQHALLRRAQAPLQSLQLHLPLDVADGTPAEQAFRCFKRCVERLTGLARYGVLLNHHGRESGGERWFDQVGLFLDKVPFAVDADTALERLAARAQLLQRLGINYLGLAQAAGSEWDGTLPPLECEVLFNFQADALQQSAAPDGGFLMDKLKDFRGILFEAAVGAEGLELHCAFRGDAADSEAVRRSVAGSEVGATAPLPAGDVAHEDAAGAAAAPLSVAAPVYSLEVRDVRKRYGDLEAVKGVSFSVRQGCCFGILGPNGAGKTSLLAMIEGIVPITSGSIRLLGMDVASEIHRIQPHVGVQLQQNNYFQFLTVAQLLKFYQELRAAVGGKRRGRSADSLLERLDLKDKLDFKVDELSGGQKQRLSIAIALLEDPDVIFFDEPTSALDPHSRISTWEFIEDLKQDPSKTVILTTHYMEEAERLCDEILLMDRGRVIAQGNPLQLAKNLGAHHSIEFQFGRGQFRPEMLDGVVEATDADWNERTDCLRLRTPRVTDTLREVLALSHAACIDVVNFDINRPTLEDVFLSHTGKELPL
ncbi:MAG: amino acid adenylation domain-containing protein [Nevskiaceae bacterium]